MPAAKYETGVAETGQTKQYSAARGPSLKPVETEPPYETVGDYSVENAIMRAREVNVYYGDNHAIQDVNLDIAGNEVIALIGPSGCCLLYTSPSPRDED